MSSRRRPAPSAGKRCAGAEGLSPRVGVPSGTSPSFALLRRGCRSAPLTSGVAQERSHCLERCSVVMHVRAAGVAQQVGVYWGNPFASATRLRTLADGRT
jgi:hypothetical protein